MASNNANKSIKDLKELNEKLKNQKFQAEAREWTLNRRNQELKEQNKMLQQRLDNALKLLDSYKLGKYDYALTSAGLLDFEDMLRGKDNDNT